MCISLRISKEMHMNPDVSICLILDTYMEMQSCILAMMCWFGQLITRLGVGLNTSDLTQQSSLITRIASDLCQVRQKYPCTVRSIIGLQHLPPQMKYHGLNEEKNHCRKKRSLFESSEVYGWLVWILTTLRVSL